MKSKLSRRNFLKTTASGLVAVTLLPYFSSANTHNLLEMGSGEVYSINDYFKRFGVTEEMIRAVMGEALSKGGDYCDIYFQNTISNSISLEDKAVNRAFTNIDYGVGIRVLKGDQTGYSFTEEITLESMKLAAKTAANIANSSKKVEIAALKPIHLPNYYKIEKIWEKISINEKIPYLQKINDKIFSLDNRIIKSNVNFSDDTTYILFANSEGKIAYDYKPLSQMAASVTAEQNGKREQNYFDLSGRRGLEFFTPKNCDLIATESVRRTIVLFDAIKPDAGEMEVVLAAGSSGILLHEAIGHGMEADFNRKGISIFADKIGKKVAESFVSIVDDGTNPNIRGSINIDDEGNETQKTYLVNNGIMESYLHDKISSSFYKVKPTGNGRRESFRCMPLPRMRNTYMLPGPHTKNDIISSVKKGIYAESFTNGEVFIGGGDFTFYVKSGYLIENGKITKPIKDVNIIGNGPQVLKDIVMVGNDMEMAEGGWTCGKNGQGVPVSMGLPTVKVSKITVGGV